MKLWRIIPLVLLVGVLGTTAFGFATELQIKKNNLVAGSADVVRCDTNVEIYWRTDWNDSVAGAKEIKLKGVTVAGINSACDGKAYRLVITDKQGQDLGIFKGYLPTPTTPSGGSYPNLRIELTKAQQFDATLVNDIHISIVDG